MSPTITSSSRAIIDVARTVHASAEVPVGFLADQYRGRVRIQARRPTVEDQNSIVAGCADQHVTVPVSVDVSGTPHRVAQDRAGHRVLCNPGWRRRKADRGAVVRIGSPLVVFDIVELGPPTIRSENPSPLTSAGGECRAELRSVGFLAVDVRASTARRATVEQSTRRRRRPPRTRRSRP